MKGFQGAEAQLANWFQRGRAAYPNLLIDEATFAAHVAHVLLATGCSEGPRFVEDLYLAAACVAGIEPAAQVFRDRFGPTIRRALACLAPASTFRDDLEQEIYEQLLVAAGPQALPQIRSFAGQAPLAAWLSVVVQRAGIRALRADRTRARTRDAAAREKLVGALYASRENEMIKEEVRPLVKQALLHAWAELSPRDRTVFHLHVVGGAGVERLGKMYGVNPSTISRWVARARAQIVSKMQTLLSAELQLTPAESDSLMGLVVSQLDVSTGDLPLPVSTR